MGIIRSKVCFLVAARLSGESGHMQAGQYRLSPSMSPADIVARLINGQVVTEWVVVPEGSTVRRIQEILQSHDLAKGDNFVVAARQYARAHAAELGIEGSSLEGYLFPDTYKLPKTMSEAAIVHLMVGRFQDMVVNGLKLEISAGATGLNLQQTISLASLVEAEAKHDSDRAHIAGVLINRLRNAMKLECDATIEYVLPIHKAKMDRKDLTLDSEYNTYLHGGLPPTPICNPGIASIKAALDPAVTRDLYYVAGPDGYHIFSQTEAEHLRAVEKVKQMTGSESR
jgi:UPF0755 protein